LAIRHYCSEIGCDFVRFTGLASIPGEMKKCPGGIGPPRQLEIRDAGC
jgi:hypothetical protein